MAWGTFKLSELKLDPLNIRTGQQDTERGSIAALFRDQKHKMVAIAADLLEVGPSPGEPIWVTEDPSEPGRFIVLEGNRRIAALKMLENPGLAAESPYAKEFAEMGRKFAQNPTRRLEARVFDTRDEAEPWIERRHMPETSGVGVQRWHSLAVHKVRRAKGAPVRRSLAVLEFLDDQSPEFEAIGEVINNKATTVDRALNSPALKDVLGVDIDRKTGAITFENGDEEAGRQLLRDVIAEMATPEFTFSTVRDADDRAAFLSGFAGRSVQAAPASDKSSAAKAAKSSAAKSDSAAAGTRRAKPDHAARATLAPKSGNLLQVTGPRLNPLYNECRNIVVEDNRNASAFLLRVFLELSTEMMLMKRSVELPQAAKERGRKAWDDIGIKLAWKIQTALKYLDPSGTAKAFAQARIGADEAARSNYAIWTLHGYFHNPSMIPQSSDLKGAWDAWESYLRAVTDDLIQP